jgi:hypothetical protein
MSHSARRETRDPQKMNNLLGIKLKRLRMMREKLIILYPQITKTSIKSTASSLVSINNIKKKLIKDKAKIQLSSLQSGWLFTALLMAWPWELLFIVNFFVVYSSLVSHQLKNESTLGFIVFLAILLHKAPGAIGFGTYLEHSGLSGFQLAKHLLV